MNFRQQLPMADALLAPVPWAAPQVEQFGVDGLNEDSNGQMGRASLNRITGFLRLFRAT